jgi:hypothetical protein
MKDYFFRDPQNSTVSDAFADNFKKFPFVNADKKTQDINLKIVIRDSAFAD